MLSPNMGNHVPPSKLWAADCGTFSVDAARVGIFDYERWLCWLNVRLGYAGDRCLFVVVPDVPFDGQGTIARFREYKERVAALRKPVAFVLQDGMGVEDVPWADADAIFIGGSTTWKTGHESGAIVTEAKRRDRWVHMGRVNSLRRLQVAVSMGCDSADGTFLGYGPNINWPRLQEWLAALERERPMVMPTA